MEAQVYSENISDKSANDKYKRCFQEMEPGIIQDPLNLMNDPEGPKNRMSDLHEAVKPMYDAIREAAGTGADFGDVAYEFRESYDTAAKSLPVATRLEYFAAVRKRTPAWDLLPHDAQPKSIIKADTVKSLPSANVADQGNAYTQNDAGVQTNTFTLDKVVELEVEVTDLLELAEPRKSLQESYIELAMEAIALEYEKQFFQGQAVNGSWFKGMDDLVSTANDFSETGGLTYKKVTKLVQPLTDERFDESEIIIFCSNSAYYELKNDLIDHGRWEMSESGEVAFGMTSFTVDNMRVVRSSGVPDDNTVYAIVGSSVYWHDLQREMVHPLGKQATSKKVGVDSYSQLIPLALDGDVSDSATNHTLVSRMKVNQ